MAGRSEPGSVHPVTPEGGGQGTLTMSGGEFVIGSDHNAGQVPLGLVSLPQVVVGRVGQPPREPLDTRELDPPPYTWPSPLPVGWSGDRPSQVGRPQLPRLS